MIRVARHLALLLPLLASTALHAQQLVEEVPFITSPDNVTLEMLSVSKVGPGDHVIDLGSGDGRIVITAAKRFGATGLGVEIVPDLVQQSLRTAREAGVADRVRFLEQDLFQTDLSPATVVTMYLLPEFNLQLRPRLLALKPGTRVVSHDWDMGDWKPDQTTVVPVPNKAVGIDKSSKIHLWVVPAKVEGAWCLPPHLGASRLDITQKYQEVEGKVTRAGQAGVMTGRVQGKVVRFEVPGRPALVLEMDGDLLRVQGAATPSAFQRGIGGACPAR
jgi:SAM-dependent methyltransferase